MPERLALPRTQLTVSWARNSGNSKLVERGSLLMHIVNTHTRMILERSEVCADLNVG